MERDDDERNVMLSVLAGIGIGAVVGAIAGLLFAPKAGSETRERIGRGLSDLGTRISDLSDQVATRVRSAVDAGKQAVGEKVERHGAEEGGDRMS